MMDRSSGNRSFLTGFLQDVLALFGLLPQRRNVQILPQMLRDAEKFFHVMYKMKELREDIVF
jgi:hypothetical protein